MLSEVEGIISFVGRRLLGTDDACRAAGVSPGLLHQWKRRGHIRNYGDGYRALWDLKEIHDQQQAKNRPPSLRVALRRT